MGSRSRKVSSHRVMAGETPRVRATCLRPRPWSSISSGDCASAPRADNIESVKDEAKGAPTAELRLAVALALTGDWQAAHLIAQKYEDDDVATWIHAVVHRMESGLANAGYWYGRVRVPLREAVWPADCLRAIEALLRTNMG